jgi:hypothetical protein
MRYGGTNSDNNKKMLITNLKEGLRGANKGYLPIGLPKLKIENKELHEIIINIYCGCGIGTYSNH